MQITDFHAKYYAHILSWQRTTDSIDSLAATLSDAKVDLNPHQIEGALFSLRSPHFSRGVIEADEVGLGKTIVAGIVISQKRAEGKQKIIVIVPANLRKQWQAELLDKFYLEAEFLDGVAFNRYISDGVQNPFDSDKIIICSYQFAHKKAEYIKAVTWDMAVCDEAHKLSNIYKNNTVMASALKESLGDCYKMLLTATPLQNSLLELYGLVSFIDDYTFGDLESFKAQFLYLRDSSKNVYDDIVSRLQTVCIRTLRRQVQEYIKYTERLLITQEFTPTDAEQEFYDKFSNYMQRDRLWSMPSSGRHLIQLILWKLLSSSTFAVAGTIKTFIERLDNLLSDGVKKHKIRKFDDIDLSDYEEEAEEVENLLYKHKKLTESEKISLAKEIEELKSYYDFACSIKKNAKGEALLVALDKGFLKLKKLKAPQKAVIFTESRRTQEYLSNLLATSQYKFVLFHGSLTTAERQKALNDFQGEAQIMVATDAAAEGLNLHFAAMIINYDLPWNPQKIEQRIGRIHRYGQKFDVVVINFLNQHNIADQRVYEILCNKFQLFEGVFGASNSVLGNIEALDFEKRIVEIYSQCRTAKEIEQSFADLRESLSPQIDEQMKDIRKKILENFDEDVTEKLKINLSASEYLLNKFETMLWNVTKHRLEGKYAVFNDESRSFNMISNPYYSSRFGYKRFGRSFYFDKQADISERYRMKCSLAQTILFEYFGMACFNGVVTFDLSNHQAVLSNLNPLLNKHGYLSLYRVEVIYSKHKENRLLFAGYCEDGAVLDQKQMQRIFDLSGTLSEEKFDYTDEKTKAILKSLFDKEQDRIVEDISIKNSQFFDEETEKLEKWAHDIKLGMEKTLRELDRLLVESRKASRGKLSLEQKIEAQEKLRSLECKRNELRLNIYDEQNKIDDRREQLIDETKKKLTQRLNEKHLFTIKWRIV